MTQIKLNLDGKANKIVKKYKYEKDLSSKERAILEIIKLFGEKDEINT